MKNKRYLALDVMRGATLAMMILVNTPGDWSAVYAPLLHADWHGVTITDFVFPFFLFIIGSALYFSSRSNSGQPHSAKAIKIIKRTIILFLLGLFLHAFPFKESLSELRILGVLQRIALAYGLAAFIVWLPSNARLAVAALLLVGYWVIYLISGSPYDVEHNIVRQVDLVILGANHLWQGKGVAFDPEGLLSTLPAVANVLVGFEATRLLVGANPVGDRNSSISTKQRQLILLGFALVSILIGLTWHHWHPINKSLWTGSFVLLTSGVAVLTLLLLVQLEKYKFTGQAYRALAIYGQNPLFIYVLSSLWVQTYFLFSINGINLYAWLNIQINTVFPQYLSSFLFAFGHVGLFWIIAYILHRKRIVITI